MRLWIEAAGVYALLVAFHFILVWRSGAFNAEFGEYPDESAHFVTALMVRDYLRTGLGQPPMTFAENYYLHYPKVALGHYPPLLYVVEALWMIVFPASRPSILALNALLAAATGLMIYFTAKRLFGRFHALSAGLLWIFLYLVQMFYGMVMAEPLAVCLAFGAILCYARYLETERWQASAWFGLLAGLAILTKQVMLFLALLPPLAVIFSGKWRLFARPGFWLAAGIALLVAGPWYYLVHFVLALVNFSSLAGLDLPRLSVRQELSQFVESLGYPLILTAGLGLVASVIIPLLRRKRVEGLWAVGLAGVLALLIFRRLAPAGFESRHLLAIFPAVLLFSYSGLNWLSSLIALVRPDGRVGKVIPLVLALAAFAAFSFRLPARRYLGLSEAAAGVASLPEAQAQFVLAASDGVSEGAFVAELGARERSDKRYVFRGNKLLAESNLHGRSYRLIYSSPQEIQQLLESVPLDVAVVLESRRGRAPEPHSRLVAKMIETYPERWKLLGVFPQLRPPSIPGTEIRLYRLVQRTVHPSSVELRARPSSIGKLKFTKKW